MNVESQNPQEIQELALQALEEYRADLEDEKHRKKTKTKGKKVRSVIPNLHVIFVERGSSSCLLQTQIRRRLRKRESADVKKLMNSSNSELSYVNAPATGTKLGFLPYSKLNRTLHSFCRTPVRQSANLFFLVIHSETAIVSPSGCSEIFGNVIRFLTPLRSSPRCPNEFYFVLSYIVKLLAFSLNS